MRSLPITVLFSLVSLVAAFGKKGHITRNTHVQSRCYHKNQTDVNQNQTTTDVNQNQTATVVNQNQTAAVVDPNQNVTGGTQNQNVSIASQYRVVAHYAGKDFLDESQWSAYTMPDLTNGLVDYVSQAAAATAGMSKVLSNGAAVIAVDNTTDLPVGGLRKSMRITTTKTFNGGLFIADIQHMPSGCSLWPAYWSYNTQNWPTGGEIDILEGVNNQVTNEMTLHTGPQCFLDPNPPTGPQTFSGNVLSTSCASSPSSNTGCGIGDADPTSYGAGFNGADGGVYAHLWDQTGISVWHFERSKIPQDIIAGSPDPKSWSIPVAFWSNAGCDMASHFYDHSLVIDTTLCGDWAGNVYGNSGCPGTCAEAVSQASNFNDAYWEINSIDVFMTGQG